MSHSKRNTSLAFFTSWERAELRNSWGSQSSRLTRDSFLPFGSCQLCLLPSRDPVACTHGDIFCRECALNNILAQKKEIKRLEKERERRAAENEEQELRGEDEERQRQVEEFEMVQMGLESKVGRGRNVVGRSAGKVTVEEEIRDTEGKSTAIKRKFELDEQELLRAAKQDRSKTRRTIDAERKDADATKALPSFWVAGQTPAEHTKGHEAMPSKVSLQPLCPAAPDDEPHTYALKTLVSVTFTEEPNPGDPKATIRSCPSCRKALSNGTRAMLAMPCGHVVCKPCASKFMAVDDKHDPHTTAEEKKGRAVTCYVCNADLAGRRSKKKDDERKKDKVRPGLVEIKSEGTGFAGGGKNVVKKSGVAFQC